jgi:mannose-6-phosphate isomerase-like protein (cupin superfamily)
MKNYKEERPWGTFENLYDEDDGKVKIITIYPGQSPSYQYHHKRGEVWTVLSGKGKLRLNDEYIEMLPGKTYEVPVGAHHQPINDGQENLVFVETQIGSYFGEDDIVRLEDKYGRI